MLARIRKHYDLLAERNTIMTNQDFIREYIKGEHRYGAYCHLGYADDKLINYSTVICRIDRENKTALVNNRKYSRTTSKIQSQLRSILTREGYTFTEYEGADASWWNYGSQGAENVTVEDMRRVTV